MSERSSGAQLSAELTRPVSCACSQDVMRSMGVEEGRIVRVSGDLMLNHWTSSVPKPVPDVGHLMQHVAMWTCAELCPVMRQCAQSGFYMSRMDQMAYKRPNILLATVRGQGH